MGKYANSHNANISPRCLSCFSQELYRALFGKQPQLKLSVVHEIIRRIKQTQKKILKVQSMALGRPRKKKNFNIIFKKKRETVKRSVEYAKIKPFFLLLSFQLLFIVVLFARGQSSPPGCRPEILLNVWTQFYLRPQAKQSRSLELATV